MERYEVVEVFGIGFLEELEGMLYEFCKRIIESNALCDWEEEYSMAWKLKERLLELIELGE